MAPGIDESLSEIGAPQEFRQRDAIVLIGAKTAIESKKIRAVDDVRCKASGNIAQCSKALGHGQVFCP